LIGFNERRFVPVYQWDHEEEGMMTEQSDLEYYTVRAAVERGLSDSATDPGIALIHTQLADRYEQLAAGLHFPPKLLVVAARGDDAPITHRA
jgi:hypothetical protein